jgi:polyhydroxybutyrate depolymerase
LRHIHGTSDKVVAYDAVGIYNSMPIPEGLAVLRRLAGADAAPDHAYEIDHPKRPRTCHRHDGETGHSIEICLHPGGHSIPAEWVAEGLDWLRARPLRAD